MSSEALWRGSDSQFGYSPFVNRNFQFKVCSSYRVRDFVLSNSRAYTCHIINSCTSALLELIIRRGGVHLGDAGGFCDQWEIGWSDPKTERGFHKRSVIKLLGEGTDYLEQMFPVRPNKTMENGKCNLSKQDDISKDVLHDKGDDDTVSKKVEKGLSSLEHAHTDGYVSSLFILRSCSNIGDYN